MQKKGRGLRDKMAVHSEVSVLWRTIFEEDGSDFLESLCVILPLFFLTKQ